MNKELWDIIDYYLKNKEKSLNKVEISKIEDTNQNEKSEYNKIKKEIEKEGFDLDGIFKMDKSRFGFNDNGKYKATASKLTDVSASKVMQSRVLDTNTKKIVNEYIVKSSQSVNISKIESDVMSLVEAMKQFANTIKNVELTKAAFDLESNGKISSTLNFLKENGLGDSALGDMARNILGSIVAYGRQFESFAGKDFSEANQITFEDIKREAVQAKIAAKTAEEKYNEVLKENSNDLGASHEISLLVSTGSHFIEDGLTDLRDEIVIEQKYSDKSKISNERPSIESRRFSKIDKSRFDFGTNKEKKELDDSAPSGKLTDIQTRAVMQSRVLDIKTKKIVNTYTIKSAQSAYISKIESDIKSLIESMKQYANTTGDKSLIEAAFELESNGKISDILKLLEEHEMGDSSLAEIVRNIKSSIKAYKQQFGSLASENFNSTDVTLDDIKREATKAKIAAKDAEEVYNIVLKANSDDVNASQEMQLIVTVGTQFLEDGLRDKKNKIKEETKDKKIESDNLEDEFEKGIIKKRGTK